ncbi:MULTISPECIES: hypothetical protein [unclassified Streptomyces]|uniref:hypothetical protein n=1 Tax=unclassified Streptomyces TaxID=2593676 RepID=UPI0037FF19B3
MLERITADPARAAGKVRRRLGQEEWQTLTEALDSFGSLPQSESVPDKVRAPHQAGLIMRPP